MFGSAVKAFSLIVTLVSGSGTSISNVGTFENQILCENAALQWETNYKAATNTQFRRNAAMFTQCSQSTGEAVAFAEPNDAGDESETTTTIPPNVVAPEVVMQAEKNDYYTIMIENLPKAHDMARLLRSNSGFLEYVKDFFRMSNMTDDDFIAKTEAGGLQPEGIRQ